MNNEPVAWIEPTTKSVMNNDQYQSNPFANETGDWIPLYTHPAKTLKDREADRKRFSDEDFNRWLDEGISDSGHTVYDLVENVCEAWHGWENSQYYRPAKTLTDEEILQEAENMFGTHFFECIDDPYWIEFARAILRKAQEK